MNRVLFHAEELPLPSWTKKAGGFVKKVLEKLGRKNWEVSVLFCNNRYIKSLNAQYRNRDEPTDVLSFPLGEPPPGLKAEVPLRKTVSGGGRSSCYLAGDIVISLDALEENARFFKVSEDEELRRLLIHGILHLTGEDHATNKAEEPMLKAQEEIFAALAGERIQEKVS